MEAVLGKGRGGQESCVECSGSMCDYGKGPPGRCTDWLAGWNVEVGETIVPLVHIFFFKVVDL